MYSEFIKDLETLEIEVKENLTIKFVTTKYRNLAKERHPDKEGGSNFNFHELQTAYRRVIEHLEEVNNEGDTEHNFEKEFFMTNNVMKKCIRSFVVYIQDHLVREWKCVLQKHLKVHNDDKGRTIFKSGEITITLYEKPKKDPRSKLHIQSNDQRKNLFYIMDNLASLYQEVSTMNSNPLQAMKFKRLEKAHCNECGKQYTNKKGLNLHMQRMHQKKSISACPTLNIGDEKEPNPKIGSIPENDPAQTEELELDENLVRDIIFDIDMDIFALDNTGPAITPDNVPVNITSVESLQCEECGELFSSEIELEEHVKNQQDIIIFKCNPCGNTFPTISDLETHLQNTHEQLLNYNLEEKDKVIAAMKETNNHIIIKNVSLDKENKRLKLAVNQSETEKVKLKKDIEGLRELLHAALGENTILNETIKLQKHFEKDKENEDVIIVEVKQVTEENLGQKKKCDKCEFVTCVPKYMKGHKVKHTGQFLCQQGCKEKFLTIENLDKHIRLIHSNKKDDNQPCFKCDKCEEIFDAKHKLRLHHTKKHVIIQPKFKCEYCNEVFTIIDEKKRHMEQCSLGFHTVNPKMCRYFAKGSCLKENCTFLHTKYPSNATTPLCRNGIWCWYFSMGICKFSHSEGGLSYPESNRQSKDPHTRNAHSNSPKIPQSRATRGWCHYMEDCTRVPRCPFSHYDQDFPSLVKHNPPENQENIQAWQEY